MKHDEDNPATWRWLAIRRYGSKAAHLHEWKHGEPPFVGVAECGAFDRTEKWRRKMDRVDTVDHCDMMADEWPSLCRRCRRAVMRDAEDAYARRKKK